jgi:hypothetical protein
MAARVPSFSSDTPQCNQARWSPIHILTAPSEQQIETGPQSLPTLLSHITLVKPWEKSQHGSTNPH